MTTKYQDMMTRETTSCAQCARELYCPDRGDVVMCVGDFILFFGGEKPTVDPQYAKIRIPRR